MAKKQQPKAKQASASQKKNPIPKSRTTFMNIPNDRTLTNTNGKFSVMLNTGKMAKPTAKDSALYNTIAKVARKQGQDVDTLVNRSVSKKKAPIKKK